MGKAPSENLLLEGSVNLHESNPHPPALPVIGCPRDFATDFKRQVLRNAPPIGGKIDIRNEIRQRQKWDVIVAWSKERRAWDKKEEVILTWNGVGYAPKDVSSILLEPCNRREANMRTQTAYRFMPNEVETERRFKVIAELGNTRPLRIVGLKATPRGGQGVSLPSPSRLKSSGSFNFDRQEDGCP